MRTISLRPGEESIRLGQLLKLVDAVPTGAQVKDVLLAGTVRVNGEPEERRGRQRRGGDIVEPEGTCAARRRHRGDRGDGGRPDRRRLTRRWTVTGVSACMRGIRRRSRGGLP